MIEYTYAPGAHVGAQGISPVWGRTFFQPLAPGAMTPFSQSMLAEVARRSWVAYYDRLGFEPPLRTPLVRFHAGRPYVNLSLAADLEARQAGLQPWTLHIDGREIGLAQWNKPGLFAGMKLARNARKIADTLAELDREIDGAIVRARTWYERVMGMRWSQAEILQIMEEIERVGIASLSTYIAARQTTESAYAGLLTGSSGLSDGVAGVNRATVGGVELVESALAARVVKLAALMQRDPQANQWLACGQFNDWEEALAETESASPVRQFLADFGHRCAGEGDLAAPRWAEDPAPVFATLRAMLNSDCDWSAPSGRRSDALPQPINARQDKQGQTLVQQVKFGLALQSRALNGYAYILAGTRQWALAAGNEALDDGRVESVDDIFYFELEEVKEMMTGEWNISDVTGIHATAADRKMQRVKAQELVPGPFFVGDAEVIVKAGALPGGAGCAEGPLALMPGLSAGAQPWVLGGVQPDFGWAMALPGAAALIAGQGSPLDPQWRRR
ncbi:MAG: hypothetical protein IPK16_23165 [Anaerolineales bacterium]|nr:hypothetical protein [Anaerolineales bacterium]